jgi:hypothetical protein
MSLLEAVHFAAQHSAFYSEKFQGINLDRCALTDLPITTKSELMAHFDQVVTDPLVRRADLERFTDDSANVGRVPILPRRTPGTASPRWRLSGPGTPALFVGSLAAAPPRWCPYRRNGIGDPGTWASAEPGRR